MHLGINANKKDSQRAFSSGVTAGKTVDNRFAKDVTETRRNEARLRRARISTMFQEARGTACGG